MPPQLGTRVPHWVLQGWSIVDPYLDRSKTKRDVGDPTSTDAKSSSLTTTVKSGLDPRGVSSRYCCSRKGVVGTKELATVALGGRVLATLSEAASREAISSAWS
nr:hypothetical protein Iba_chr13fCG8560 [Ipomoea batatas]GME01507.1 hypothetical protein Iba_scaffold552589CG0010 [Ipomoea batatas]